MSPGTWPTFNRYLYVGVKQNSGERFRATWSSCFLSMIVFNHYQRYLSKAHYPLLSTSSTHVTSHITGKQCIQWQTAKAHIPVPTFTWGHNFFGGGGGGGGGGGNPVANSYGNLLNL